MIRGTTPTLTFQTPFLASSIEAAYITFKQGAKTVLEKNVGNGLTVSDYAFTVNLTQTEMNLFAPNGQPMVEIQSRVKFIGGGAAASTIIERKVGRVLKDGVI